MIESAWQGEIAIIRFNRPDRKNALTPPMIDRFSQEVAATHGRARAVVIAGQGDALCSGFDLALCLDDPAILSALLRGLTQAILALRRHPAPIVIAAHGAAIAGGCALLGGGDVVITNNDAKLGYPVIPLGISPAISAPFLSNAVGGGNARARLLDPRLIGGLEALRIGLVHECVATAAEVLPRAMTIAADLAAKPRAGMECTKAWLNELDGSLDRTRAERALGASLGLVGSAEERERLKVFFAR